MSNKFFSRNGKILPITDATIPLKNMEYAYGFGVYETIRVRNGIVYFTNQHIKRLLQSAIILGITHQFTEKAIEKYIYDLLKTEKVNTCNIKILLIGAKTKQESLLFILSLSPLFPKRKFYTEGVKTISFQYERQFPKAKTLNMLGSYLAYKKALEQECYDALFTDYNGNILEGTRTNFFTIKDKTIFTPPEDKILGGITKETVLYVAKKQGFKIKELNISPVKLSQYDGAFLTTTIAKILPIKQIDDFIFSEISNQIKMLMQKYDDFLEVSKGIFKS